MDLLSICIGKKIEMSLNEVTGTVVLQYITGLRELTLPMKGTGNLALFENE